MSNEALKDQKSEELEPAEPLSIPALMQRIRADIKKEIEAHGRSGNQPAFKPREANPNSGNFKAGALLHSEELAFLNSNYAYGILDLNRIASHRPGVIGKVIVKLKRKILSWFWDSLLKDYFSKEREFQANVVRMMNNVSRYVDERDASNFWELIRKIDVDLTKALDRIERIADEQVASLRLSEKRLNQEFYSALTEVQARITSVLSDVQKNSAEIATLDSVARGLEGLIARAAGSYIAKSSDSNSVGSQEATGYKLDVKAEALAQGIASKDYSYLMLENRFRGSEAEIRARQQFYVECFASRAQDKKLLDIGCGRGELLEAFRAAGYSAYGIDLDTAMIETCRSKNLEVQEADLLSHLQATADGSIAGVIALQVVEHLNMQQLKEWFELCTHKVARGGRVIFETINPRSLLALSSNYFRDPTHVWPLHPDTLAYLMSLSGLDIVETKYLAPVPTEAQLQMIPQDLALTPRYADQVQKINANLKQLNDLLYGHQDYCIVAQVR